MKALATACALSVCGPGSATHSCTEFSNRWYSQSPPAALGIRLQPADGVVGVLHTGRVGHLGCNRHVDGDDEQAARSQRAVHRLLGQPVLSVPGAAVQIENGREWSR